MRIIVLSTFTDCYLHFTSNVRINLKWMDIEASFILHSLVQSFCEQDSFMSHNRYMIVLHSFQDIDIFTKR